MRNASSNANWKLTNARNLTGSNELSVAKMKCGLGSSSARQMVSMIWSKTHSSRSFSVTICWCTSIRPRGICRPRSSAAVCNSRARRTCSSVTRPLRQQLTPQRLLIGRGRRDDVPLGEVDGEGQTELVDVQRAVDRRGAEQLHDSQQAERLEFALEQYPRHRVTPSSSEHRPRRSRRTAHHRTAPDHPIAPQALGPVQRLVGRLDQRFDATRVVGPRRHPHRHADVAARLELTHGRTALTPLRHAPARRRPQRPRGPVCGRITANSSPPYRATMSVSRATARRIASQPTQHLVARAMPLTIVVQLEVVDVEEQQAEREVVALGPGPSRVPAARRSAGGRRAPSARR